MGLDWEVGGWESGGGSVVGREGGRTLRTYKVITNTHRNNQCKMIMGNIIVCPAGSKKLNNKGAHCRFGIAGNLGGTRMADCVHKWGGHHMAEV